MYTCIYVYTYIYIYFQTCRDGWIDGVCFVHFFVVSGLCVLRSLSIDIFFLYTIVGGVRLLNPHDSLKIVRHLLITHISQG